MDDLQRRGLCPFTFGRVLDRVYSKRHGQGVVHRISYDPPLMGLVAAFDNGEFQKYTLSGYINTGRYSITDQQDLFWDAEFTATPMMPEFVAARNSVITEPRTIGFGG